MTKKQQKSKKKTKEVETKEKDRYPNSDAAPLLTAFASPGGEKEGHFLLGAPTFVDIGNGRWRCTESGHELLAKDKESYASSRACRLALINAAVSRMKPPLSAFEPHPTNKSKLVCKITGDVINKTEEHIWKHINGKRFYNKLEQVEQEKVEQEKVTPKESTEKEMKESKVSPKSTKIQKKKDKKKKVDENVSLEKEIDGNITESEEVAPKESMEKEMKESKVSPKSTKIQKKKNKKKKVDENVSLEKETDANSTESEEVDFWIPPVGGRWDFDDGGDRWECLTSIDEETDEGKLSADGADEKVEPESAEVPKNKSKKKRMSADGGCDNSSSRKKKIKKKSASIPNDNQV